MAIKVFIQSMFYGFLILVIHWFSHVWPILGNKPEIIALFPGALIVFHWALDILAFPLNHLLGWMFTTFNEFNLVGPFIAGFVVTYFKIKRASKPEVVHVNG